MSDQIYVEVPRAVVEQYWHRPFEELVLAAEAGTDGLALASTKIVPWSPFAPTEAMRADPRRKDYCEQYDRQQDRAYFWAGDSVFDEGQAWLFLKSW